MISNNKNLLFVYGTLRNGFKHHFLEPISTDMKFVGKGELLASLFDIGEYPAIIPAKQENEIVEGDIFEITHSRKIFKILDEYEGFYKNDLKKSEYLRKKSIINLENGKNITAWAYWYNFSVENKPRILNKNYLAYLQEIAQNK